MRARHLLALTAAAMAFSALPASATTPLQILPDCETHLVNAAAGAVANCPTQGPPGLGNRNVAVLRTVRVAVANGSVDASLTCDGHEFGHSTVAVGAPYELSVWGGNSCNVAIAALTGSTTAVATSTYSYVIILD
jgi:hypothetical protein